MSWWTGAVERLRAVLRPARQDRDLDEELRCHLAQEIEARIARGETPDTARRAALAAFGSVAACKDEVRDARGIRPLTDLAGDVRYALRALGRSPAFAASVVLVLGLATGAAATMFGVADVVLVSDLPYPDAGRLVRIYQTNSPHNRFSLSAVDAQGIAARAHSFDVFGVVQRGEAAISGAGAPERVPVGRATAGFFSVLRAAAAAGRLVDRRDESAAAAPVVVLSHALAMRIAPSAGAAIGRTLTIDGVGHTVVGVLAPGVNELGGIRASAWPALRLAAPTRRGPFGLQGFARLRAGVPLDAAARDLSAVSDQLFPLWASSFQDRDARLTPVPLRDAVIGDAARPVGMFSGAVALVLLIAVANVATLMLVRASGRQAELAVRATLGATRLRLARLLATEILILTTAAGLVGWAVATAGVGLVQAMATGLPRVQEVAVGPRTLACIGVTILASAAVLTLSLLAVAMPGPAAAVRGDARRIGTSRRAQGLRGLFVALEFALALPLLLGSSLLADSFLRLQRVDPGFDPAGLVALNLSLPAARYATTADVQQFWQRALARATAVPGVVAAGLTTAVPPDNGGDVNNFDLHDRPVAAGTAQPVAPWTAVGGDYFGTMGIPLLDGRLFSDRDTADAAPVLIVSRAWAERYYPRERAVGRQLVSGGCTACPLSTIVGVVGDVKYLGLREAGEGVYEPATQAEPRTMSLMVRSTLGTDAALRAAGDAVGSLDSELPIAGMAMADRLERSLAGPRRWTTILGLFAGVALALAALGIFGLVSYVVKQRRRELGIRIALGADPGAVTRFVVRHGMRHALVGSAAGLGAALLEARALQPLLFQAHPLGPVLLAGVSAVLLCSALLACWLPGRHAARIPAVEILSGE